MIIVKIEGKMSIDSAVKKLRSKFIATQVSKELNERKTFKKKSVKRREVLKKAKHIEAIRKTQS